MASYCDETHRDMRGQDPGQRAREKEQVQNSSKFEQGAKMRGVLGPYTCAQGI
jgi:hypothetical protein